MEVKGTLTQQVDGQYWLVIPSEMLNQTGMLDGTEYIMRNNGSMIMIHKPVAPDPWIEIIRQYLTVCNKDWCTISELMNAALYLPADRQDKNTRNRIAGILQTLGGKYTSKRVNGTPTRVYKIK